MIRQFDESVGWTLKPNRMFELVSEEWHSTVKTNELGFRGPMPDDDESNVLVLGDSNTVSLRVDYSDTFLSKLEQRVPYTISNISVGGWASINQYLALNQYADRYDPDFVLFQLYLQNGVVENQKFAVTHDGEVCIDAEHLDMVLPEYQDESSARRVARRVVAERPALHRMVRAAGLVDRSHPLTVYQREYTDELRTGLEKTKSLVSKAAAYCDERDIGFGVVSVPSPWQTEDAWFKEALDEYDLEDRALDMRKPDRAIKSHCAEEGIAFHDLYDRLNHEAESPYFETVDHWTERGHDIVADELSTVIEKWT
jgi:hypothetical protein